MKNRTLEFVGTKDLLEVKKQISENIFRYVSVVNKKIPFSEFHGKLWSLTFDSEDPDSGWGYRIHKTVYPLTGTNVEIVPKHVKGYLMDKSCNASYYSEIDLSESFTYIAKLVTDSGDRYRASVYCYVSESFDGSSPSFGIGSDCINMKIVSGKVLATYDLNGRGVWQKLEIDFDCVKGNVPILISFWKKGVKDFSGLKGYVIFAYPVYSKVDKNENKILPLSTAYKEDLIEYNINTKLHDQVNNTFLSKLKVQKNLDYPFSEKHDWIVKCSIFPLENIHSMKQNNKYLNNFSILLSKLDLTQEIKNEKDPIRNFAKKFISEDTIYHPYKTKISLRILSNQFINERVLRWIFASKLYSSEYTTKQKIFGGGFNFLNWYGYYFLKDKTASDWPHNPFLSILLYSGIIGLLVYCFFLFKVFYYYLKYLKEYPLIFIFFIISFFFSFFSGGSPFDPPIMGFFSILPFFIHISHKKKIE